MKFGHYRFAKQLDKIEHILQDAQTAENRIAYIYENDLRTPFFMLEALCRLYKGMHNSNSFKKLLRHTKAVEDALGHYDFYLALYVQIKDEAGVPEVVRKEALQKQQEAEEALELLLDKNDWWSGKRLQYWNKKLQSLKWKKEAQENKYIQKYYKKEIKDIYDFIGFAPFPFEDMEDDVHELRRKLRWLSIYCHASDDLIGLKEVYETVPENYTKYLTDKTINSPFSQLNVSVKYQHPVYLNKYSFLALSWAIDAFGTLKDKGLAMHALEEIVQGMKLTEEEQKAITHYLKDYDEKNAELLETATSYTTQLLIDNVLNTLVLD